jgi:hypothetical protein
MNQTVTIVFERGELLWAVVVYCAVQFVIEYALAARRASDERGR